MLPHSRADNILKLSYSVYLYIPVHFKNWILSFVACLFSVKWAASSGTLFVNWLPNNDNKHGTGMFADFCFVHTSTNYKLSTWCYEMWGDADHRLA